MITINDGPFSRIKHSRTADEVIDQIELLLLEGVLRDGERLPGERELSERMEVSRPILRDALKELESRGLLVSRHGGGTFVGDMIGQVFSKPLAELISRHDRATKDYLEFRREIEGHAAGLAARRATKADHAVLSGIISTMHRLHEEGDFEAELEADIELHNAIGEAAHNIILMHTLKACYRLLSEGMFYHRRMTFDLPSTREKLLAQHGAIVTAILAGDAQAARQAAESHIDFVAAATAEARALDARNQISQMRKFQRDNSIARSEMKGQKRNGA